jgi:hypothetical protein
MKKIIYPYIKALLLLSPIFLVFCSTNKDAFLNRTYHGMTAKYNGYFNANELLTMGINSYEKNRSEDFYDWLSIQPIPSEEESKSMHAAIDTAVVKCTKVIRNHSMPSADSPKEAEYNPWIDENWLTIGKAYYYRRDFEKALKNFQFVKRFFQKDPSKYLSELWIAKIYIEENRLTEALTILDELQDEALQQKKKSFFQKFSKTKVKDKNADDFKPEMNDEIQFEIYKTRADLFMRKKQAQEALFPLTMAVNTCRTKREKSRLSFILGQLYLSTNRVDSALISFKHAISPAATYDVSFNAKLTCAVLGTSERDVKMLERMLRDEKNAGYKDQIYFAKAQLEYSRGNTSMAKVYYTRAAFYSTKNKRQKALSYEKLGDLAYTEKSYLSAQKYYDSCATNMPEGYPNGEFIRTKASKLSNLVSAMEIAIHEDSVQRIAKMDNKAQTTFIKEVIKQLKEEAQQRKELEAAKLRALQEQAQGGSQSGAGDKWVFNNPKLKQEGYDEFRKQWGDRVNDDDWRRSSKFSMATDPFAVDPTGDSTAAIQTASATDDTLDVETMRNRLPLSDSAYTASVLREIDARYTAGSLYKDLLEEPSLASEQFERILSEETRNITDLSAAYQLYKINESSGKETPYKTHILLHYPKSDAANYLLDPAFFEKLKENRVIAEKEYLTVLHEYEMLNYKLAFDLTDKVVQADKSNAYRAEYLLLNVLAKGQLTSDKSSLIPMLTNIIEEKPGTPQAIRAKELLSILEKGVSVFEPYVAKSNGIFVYNDSVTQFIMVLLDEEEDFDELKASVSDFTSKSFKKNKLKVTSALSTKETKMVLVADFKSSTLAMDYLNLYKASIDILGDFQNNKISIISQENLKKLIESDNFDGYKTFYDLNY